MESLVINYKLNSGVLLRSLTASLYLKGSPLPSIYSGTNNTSIVKLKLHICHFIHTLTSDAY